MSFHKKLEKWLYKWFNVRLIKWNIFWVIFVWFNVNTPNLVLWFSVSVDSGDLDSCSISLLWVTILILDSKFILNELDKINLIEKLKKVIEESFLLNFYLYFLMLMKINHSRYHFKHYIFEYFADFTWYYAS
jgi:hypothetical protein